MSNNRDLSIGPLVVCTAAVGLAAVPLGAAAMAFNSDVALPVGVCAALLSMPVAWLCARRATTRRRAAVGTIVLCIPAGILNSPVSLMVVESLDGHGGVPSDYLATLVLATVVGAIYAAPLGAVFGLLYCGPVRRANALARQRPVDGTDRALRACGLWLLCVCVPLGLFCLAIGGSASASSSTLLRIAAACGLPATLGAAAAAFGEIRIRLRQSWFETICAGQDPRWAVLVDDEEADRAEDLRPLFAGNEPTDGILARRVPGPAAGAYRTGMDLVPWARVQRPI